MQALLAILTFLFSVIAWLTGGTAWWLIGGILMVAVVPFTLIVIMPTNKALMDSSLDKRTEKANHLLRKWGRLHAVRTMLSVLALLVFLFVLIVRI